MNIKMEKQTGTGNSDLYKEFIDVYQKAKSANTKQENLRNAQAEWKSLKKDKGAIEKRKTELNLMAVRKKNKNDSYFLKLASVPSLLQAKTFSEEPDDKLTGTQNRRETSDTDSPDQKEMAPEETVNKRETPAQDKLSKGIAQLEHEIVTLKQLLDTGMSTDPCSLRKTIREKEKKLLEQQKKKRQLMMDVKRQVKSRENVKRKHQALSERYKDVSPPRKAGRPPLEEKQEGLLETIKEIARIGGSADDRRRNEIIRVARTLDDLTEELKHNGYSISRSATYLRLVPHRWNTSEGKRHVNTVKVKLTKPECNEHNAHQDSRFAAATLKHIHQLAATLGPEKAVLISQDDKARVPIGIPAAQKQAPLLMSMEYRVCLPDHDWVIGERHKLIPSVYALCKIKKDMIGDEHAVTYSGPTYIAIRSGKHDRSTAFSHGEDMVTIIEDIESFSEYMKEPNGSIKPVVIIATDGGPDENPRYSKVLQVAAQHFIEYNLDGLFVATNAPGRSAFNPVERRMAPLSHELTGLILPHDSYGTHLNSSHKTVDEELEKKNFSKAGEILAEVWSDTIIDNHPVVASFIPAQDEPSRYETLIPLKEEWKTRHVRQSQYCLQIVKCTDLTCCSPCRSSLKSILPDGFLPAPVAIKQTNHGLIAPEPEESQDPSTHFGSLFQHLALSSVMPKEATQFKKVPYDLYCPSVAGKLCDQVCTTCGWFTASKKALSLHSAIHKGKARPKSKKTKVTTVVRQEGNEVLIKRGGELEWVDVSDVDLSSAIYLPTRRACIPQIESVQHWAKSPWSTDE